MPSPEEVAIEHFARWLPWFQDAPLASQQPGAKLLVDAWFAYPELGIVFVQRPWVIDGIDDAEIETLRHLQDLAFVDVALAKIVAAYPWLEGGSQTPKRV